VDPDATRAIVHDLYDAFARCDVERIAALIGDDIDWVIYGPVQVFSFIGPRSGKADVLKSLTAIASDYALERHEPEIVIVEGNRAAVMSNAAFVQRATRRMLSIRLVDLLQFRGGRLIEFRQFCDTFDAAEQALGRWLVD
jgi:ketosteroid isomerase-like protein